jgi:tRNA U34 5-carboxymethylaminomethyl modifying enzyme MnmG/GidA
MQMTPLTFSKFYAVANKYLGSIVSELSCAWIDADYLLFASRNEQRQQELSDQTLERIENGNVKTGVLAGQMPSILKSGGYQRTVSGSDFPDVR